MKKQFTMLLALMAITSYAFGQKSITQLNTVYAEDFNSLNSSANDSVLPTGWFFSEAGTNANNTYAPNSGTSTSGNTYSYGAVSNERALGTLASGTNVPTIGVGFTNNTGTTVDSISISYYVEQWRLGATGRQDSMKAQWSPNNILWFDLPLLTIYSPVTSGTVGALNGDSNAYRQLVSHVLPVPSIANGVTVWLRWVDANITGSDDGLAIDDFALIAWGPISGSTDPSPCTEPYFSEYLEGSSNNKALEIYNPTSADLNLANYTILRFNNGSSVPSDTMFLTETIATGDVYVIANPSADAAILALADTTHTITFFNGDDALALVNISTGKIVDIFGVIGQDPGTNWPIGTGATSEYTLVRKDTVRNGTLDSTTWTHGWDVYAQNTDTYLGTHTSDCIVPPVVKTVTFTTTFVSIMESDDSVAVGVTVNNPDLLPVTVDVNIGAATTAISGDYSYTNQTLIFGAGSDDTQYVFIEVHDDLIYENNKLVQLRLENATTGVLGDSVFFLVIIDNEPMPLSQIRDVNNVNSNGVAIHMDSVVKIGGIVHDFNHNGNFRGFEFAIQNPDEGIVVYHGTDTLGYSVRMGDSIIVIGRITQYNGLIEIVADSIRLISQNHTLYAPKVVNVLNESTEAVLVRLPVYRLVNPNQWGSGTFSFNAHITNGIDTFIMRVHDESDLFGTAAPTGYFNVTGIGWQFDNSSPYLSGYQIIPRMISDITALADPTIMFGADSQVVNENIGTIAVDVTLNNPTGEAHSVDVLVKSSMTTATDGDDYTYMTQTVTFPANSTTSQTVTITVVDDNLTEGDETIVLVLRNASAFAVVGADSIHTIVIEDNDPNSINNTKDVKVQVYPNPAENFTKVVSAEPIQVLTVTNMVGQQQLRAERINNYEFDLNLNGLAAGVYLITIEGECYNTVRQLMVK